MFLFSLEIMAINDTTRSAYSIGCLHFLLNSIIIIVYRACHTQFRVGYAHLIALVQICCCSIFIGDSVIGYGKQELQWKDMVGT